MASKRSREEDVKATRTAAEVHNPFAVKPTVKAPNPITAALATHSAEEEEAKPKVIMSRAQRRKLKKPAVVVTSDMKEKIKEEKREIRKFMRAMKANGSRRKVQKLREQYAAKRAREENEEDIQFAFSPDAPRPRQRRRLE